MTIVGKRFRTRLFTQPFAQSQIKEHIKVRRTGLCRNHRWPVSSPHKGPVTRETFSFDVITLYMVTSPVLNNCPSDSKARKHYSDVIMGATVSQISSLTIVFSTVHSDADHRQHQSSASLAFVRGIHRGPVNFPHKWPVTRKVFPFDDVITDMIKWATSINRQMIT